MKYALPLLAALFLAGCNQTGLVPGTLPTVPADIQTCFRTNGVVRVPEKTLTVAEVESLWKQDRVRAVVLRKCGNRLLAWYNALQREWK